jgi:hypothetical protein
MFIYAYYGHDCLQEHNVIIDHDIVLTPMVY